MTTLCIAGLRRARELVVDRKRLLRSCRGAAASFVIALALGAVQSLAQTLPSLDQPGPWAVGYRTVTSKGAPVTSVWYPVAPAEASGDWAKYNVAEWTSQVGWRAVPYTSPIAHQAAIAGEGPFPLVVINHGKAFGEIGGGYRCVLGFGLGGKLRFVAVMGALPVQPPDCAQRCRSV